MYSLAAIASEKIRGGACNKEMQTVSASLHILQQWISHFSGQWNVTKKKITIDGTRHLILELHSILDGIYKIAEQCEKNLPACDGIQDKWKQFSGNYNKLVDDFRSINEECVRHVPDLTVFRLKRL